MKVAMSDDVETLIRNLHIDLTEPHREMIEIDREALREVLTLLLKSHKALRSPAISMEALQWAVADLEAHNPGLLVHHELPNAKFLAELKRHI